METNKEALAKIKMSKKNLSLKIADLEEEDNVKKYLELNKLLVDTNRAYDELLYACKLEEYASCKHLSVSFEDDYDYYEGRHPYRYGCLKCGLNTYLLEGDFISSIEEKANNDYIKKHCKFGFPGVNNTKLYIDTYENFERARVLYSSFHRRNKGVSDKIIIEMVSEALDNEAKKAKEKLKNKNI